MKKNDSERRYPEFYEKIVPIALVIIGLAITLLLIVVVATLVGWIPG